MEYEMLKKQNETKPQNRNEQILRLKSIQLIDLKVFLDNCKAGFLLF